MRRPLAKPFERRRDRGTDLVGIDTVDNDLRQLGIENRGVDGVADGRGSVREALGQPLIDPLRLILGQLHGDGTGGHGGDSSGPV